MNTRLKGHVLLFIDSYCGYRFAVCQCGEECEVMLTEKEAREKHRAHKAAIAEQRAAEETANG